MSGNIMIRKAKNNYVCECCGHIIRAGSEYLDKVILNNGKCVQHDRYHDVCPKLDSKALLFDKIIEANGDLPVANSDGIKKRIAGIAFAEGEWYILYHDWDNPSKGMYMPFTSIFDYHDADGKQII
jgi:hypothetical protein